MALKLKEGAPPSSTLMLSMGGLALIANLFCLRLLWKFRELDVNMSSTFECSRNDVIANVGLLMAAALVAATRTPWPDLIAGAIIAALFLRSAARVFDAAIGELFSG